jgi:hypothetical protein
MMVRLVARHLGDQEFESITVCSEGYGMRRTSGHSRCHASLYIMCRKYSMLSQRQTTEQGLATIFRTETSIIYSWAQLFYDVQIVRILPVTVSLYTV